MNCYFLEIFGVAENCLFIFEGQVDGQDKMEIGFISYIRYLDGDYVPNESSNFYKNPEDAFNAAVPYAANRKSIGVDKVEVDDGLVTILDEIIIPTEYCFYEEED